MDIHHALVLNLHQPSGNLEDLLEHNEWEAREILWALDRIPRSLWQYSDIARVTLSLSGTLLETLANPEFQKRVFGIVKCGELIWFFQNQIIFETARHRLLSSGTAAGPTGRLDGTMRTMAESGKTPLLAARIFGILAP